MTRLLCRPNCTVRLGYSACRALSSSPSASAGHNKWSQIKHDKAKNDRAKARERQLVGKEICSAARSMLPLYCTWLLANRCQCGVQIPSSILV